ncbi:MAG TPA: chlorite dismutase family protein [Armatimonadaceae bacterium]|nr:chlorite dismutase family protein [Armatimonadaceae bacterium]
MAETGAGVSGGGENTPRQFVNYLFFQVDPAWRRLPDEERRAGKEEFARVVDDYRGRAIVVPFSTVATRADCDFLLWRVAYDLETLQEMTSRLLATGIGRWLTRSYSFLGQAKRSTYLDPTIHPSQEHKRGIIRPGEYKYLFVYPFVKTRAWFALSEEERGRAMKEHIVVGHKYPSIHLNTIYSFGLDDQEWVVAFESNQASDFVDLVMELRHTEASAYTLRDTPIFTCVRGENVRAVLDTLGG